MQIPALLTAEIRRSPTRKKKRIDHFCDRYKEVLQETDATTGLHQSPDKICSLIN